jgi:hypothetical protein
LERIGEKSSERGIAERMLTPVFRKAKIEGAHARCFRRTLATDVLARGGTMADAADVLGISEHIPVPPREMVGGLAGRISTIMRVLFAAFCRRYRG